MKIFSNKRKNKPFEKNRFRFFLLFIGLSFIFWIVTKFSNSYSQAIIFNIKFKDIPPTVVVDKEVKRQIKISLQASGFQLFWHALFVPTIELSLSQAQLEKGEGTIFFNRYSDEIQEIFKDINVLNIEPSNLTFYYSTLDEKKIPIYLESNIQYKLGYNSWEEMRLEPDSIVVRGAKYILDTLSYIYTKPLLLENVSSSFEKEIGFKKIKSVDYLLEKTKVVAEVRQFTDKTIIIPINITNIPDSIKLKLFPEYATVTFTVSFEEVNLFKPADFQIVCDFEVIQKNGGIKKIPIWIEKQPKRVRNIKLSPLEVEYLIRK